jgi:hypothetical protein
MSLNKFTDVARGVELGLKIGSIEMKCDSMECKNMIVETVTFPPDGDLTAHDVNVNNNLNVKADDLSNVNFKTPDQGQPNYVLTTDGVGSVFFAPPDTGSSDITYNGTPPVVIGQHLKFSATNASVANQSVLTEVGTQFDFGGYNIENTGDVNLSSNDIVNAGTINYTTLNPPISTDIQETYDNTNPSAVVQLATTKPYIFNAVDTSKLFEIDGDNKSVYIDGELNMNSNNKITNLQTPTTTFEGSNKEYVDAAAGNVYSNMSGGNMFNENTFLLSDNNSDHSLRYFIPDLNNILIGSALLPNNGAQYSLNGGKSWASCIFDVPSVQPGIVSYSPVLKIIIFMNGTQQYHSIDGINFTLQTPPPIGWGGFVLDWIPNLNLFIRDSINVGFTVETSTDGINWTPRVATQGVTSTAYTGTNICTDSVDAPPCRTLAYHPIYKRLISIPLTGGGSIWTSDDDGVTYQEQLNAITTPSNCRKAIYIDRFKQVVFGQRLNNFISLGFTSDGTSSEVVSTGILKLLGGTEIYGLAYNDRWGLAIGNNEASSPKAYSYGISNTRNTHSDINLLGNLIMSTGVVVPTNGTVNIYGGLYIGGMANRPVVSGGYTATQPLSLSNTGVETSIVGTGFGTLTIPSDIIKVGSTSKVYAGGDLLCDTKDDEIKFNLKINGSTVSSFIVSLDVVGSPQAWQMNCILLCHTIGVTGTMYINTIFTYVKDNLDSKGS